MHDGMPYGRNQGQRQGHSREVDRQSPTGLIFIIIISTKEVMFPLCVFVCYHSIDNLARPKKIQGERTKDTNVLPATDWTRKFDVMSNVLSTAVSDTKFQFKKNN